MNQGESNTAQFININDSPGNIALRFFRADMPQIADTLILTFE